MEHRTMLYVYQGLGAKARCLQHLLASLTRWAQGTKYQVDTISPQAILKGGWQERAALLAFGGGFDQGFLQSLGSAGQAMIREYVEGGGAYLGLCAGGYFGCAYIEFDKGGPLEVCGPRDMKFFQGVCIGPAFPGFHYKTNQGSYAANLSWSLPRTHQSSSSPSMQDSQTQLHCYFQGGGYFVPMQPAQPSATKHETIAVYNDLLESPAAVVKCRVGRGVAVLSGVHFEYRGQDLDPSDIYLQKIIPLLEKSETQRQTCFDSVMVQLGLEPAPISTSQL